MLSNFTRLKLSHQLDEPSNSHRRPSPPLSYNRPPSTDEASLPLSLSSRPTGEGESDKVLAIDCEMVGVGPDGKKDALARCALINAKGQVLVDVFVLPKEKVTDWRTEVSGVEPKHMWNASSWEIVRKQVATLIHNKILIWHSLHCDLRVLNLSHPRALCRDTAFWRHLCPNGPVKLRILVREHLAIDIQTGSHDPLEDARATMKLYLKFRKDWEKDIQTRTPTGNRRYKRAKTPKADPIQAHQRSHR